MKTERRHELETNTLAQGLNDWGDKLRPYSSAILGVIAALLAIYIIASMWNSYQMSRDRAAWDAYQAAVMEGDAELTSLQRLANGEDFAGTDVQEWALLGWADRQLLLASRMYLTNRDTAKEKLTNIVEVYQQFADSGSTPEIRNRARLGLARLNEMEGELDEAKQNYQRVEGALSTIAEERIKTLDSKPAQATIDWLATAELPKPATPSGPGTPGDRPGFEASTPKTDPLGVGGPLGTAPATAESLEDILSGLGGGAATPATETPATETAPTTPGGASGDEAGPPATEAPAPSATEEAAPAPTTEDAASEAGAPPATEASGASEADAPASEQPATEGASAEATSGEPPAESATIETAPTEEAPAGAAPAQQ